MDCKNIARAERPLLAEDEQMSGTPQVSEAERRLAERGLRIEEYDRFQRDAEQNAVGFIGLGRDDAGMYAVAYVAPQTAPRVREWFAGWVEEKVDNYLECGPARDGWVHRESDGGWQLWAYTSDVTQAHFPQH
jgi:hypothetical protein